MSLGIRGLVIFPVIAGAVFALCLPVPGGRLYAAQPVAVVKTVLSPANAAPNKTALSPVAPALPPEESVAPSRWSNYEAPQSVADLAAALIGAVVNISTSQTVKGVEDSTNLSVPPPAAAPDSSPFQEYFQDFFADKDGKGTVRKTQSLGSGFIIDAERGLVVTNNHVIADADDIEVNFSDGSKLKAKLLGKDAKTDIALLQIDPKVKKLQAVSFGNSVHARIGDWVMAIGNPFGFGGSVTLGIVSARNRNINSGPYDDFIQTDAAINRGNSGGPLFDMEGKVIGINTAIVSPSGGSIGIGFAIPSELAFGVVRQLREFGETRRGWLAVRIQPVTADIAASFGLPAAEGAMVSGLIAGAKDVDNKELRDGDIIMRFGNKPVASARLLPRMVAESPVGVVVPVTIWRNGKEQTVKVKPGLLDEKMDDSSADDEPPPGDAKQRKKDKDKPKTATTGFILGMQLAELTDDIRNQYSIVKEVEGVAVLAVIPDSNAAEKRIAAGNVIVDINQEAVKTPEDVEKRLAVLKDSGRKNALLMLAAPTGELRFVTVLLD
ncbi:MAG: Do family serine endopeptidase [Candidatus Tokpelaia sp.]|nr:MAG: Do family serine endopeptidase [Candidatus Tokpelaia sp.]KAA6206595.1 MAG: Do family serine endopeptidase [Candidatus Tokpelaia sp.]